MSTKHTKSPKKKAPTVDSRRVRASRPNFNQKIKSLEGAAAKFGEAIEDFSKKNEEALDRAMARRIFLVAPGHPIPVEVVQRVRREVFATEANASEALYGFMGWLTTRDKRVILSSHDNAGAGAVLVSEFIKHQGLPEVREDYTVHIKSMAEVATDVTNEPPPAGSTACLLTEDMAADRCIQFMSMLNFGDQNRVLAKVISHVDKMRDAHKAAANDEITHHTKRFSAINDANVELDRILDREAFVV